MLQLFLLVSMVVGTVLCILATKTWMSPRKSRLLARIGFLVIFMMPFALALIPFSSLMDFDHLAQGKEPPSYDDRCPFPGLAPFDKTNDEDFRDFFFGREQLVQEMARREQEQMATEPGPAA